MRTRNPLTRSVVVEARLRVAGGESVPTIARGKGVNSRTLYYAVYEGGTWRSADGDAPPVPREGPFVLSHERVVQIAREVNAGSLDGVSGKYEISRSRLIHLFANAFLSDLAKNGEAAA